MLASKWDEGRERVRRSHPDAARINARIAEVSQTAQMALSEVQTSGEFITAEGIQEAVERRLNGEAETETDLDFLSFWQRRNEGYKRREQIATWKSYRAVLRKFKEFLEVEHGRTELPFSAVDARLIKAFRTYCYEERKNKANTVGKALGTIRTMVRAAMAEGHVDPADYPFRHITVDSEPTSKEKLTPEQIEQIDQLDLEVGSLLAEIRRWFIFAYQTGGMRFSDVATLRPEHLRDGRVFYRMEKTADPLGVPLTGRAKEILARYQAGDGEFLHRPWVFPILEGVDPEDATELHRVKESKNALANKYLKKLRDRAELGQPVTFHLSRNAAAWRFYKRTGDIYKTSKILGHSSVTQTEEYLRGFEDDSIDEDFLDAFG